MTDDDVSPEMITAAAGPLTTDEMDRLTRLNGDAMIAAIAVENEVERLGLQARYNRYHLADEAPPPPPPDGLLCVVCVSEVHREERRVPLAARLVYSCTSYCLGHYNLVRGRPWGYGPLSVPGPVPFAKEPF